MSHRQRRARLDRRRRSAAGIAAKAIGVGGGALAAALIPVGSAQAAGTTFTVTNLNDSGPGSLRQAITDADSAAGNDTIVFASGLSGDIQLQSPLPYITTNLEIHGPGARSVALDASAVSSGLGVIHDHNNRLAVSGLTLEKAPATMPFVSMLGGGVTLDADTITSNHDGGLAGSDASFTVTNSTFSGNSGQAAIRAEYQDTVSVIDSTITGNTGSEGGGISNYISQLTVTDSTITGNAATQCGGGIWAGGYSPPEPAGVTLQDSIVAGNTQSSGCSYSPDVYMGLYTSPLSSSFTLIENATDLSPSSSDLTSVSPDLGPLQNNGGPTDTELPKPGSPVIDAGQAFSESFDQRGLSRTVEYPGVSNSSGGDGTDMGAAELQPPPELAGISPSKAVPGQSVTITGTGVDQASEVLFGGTKAGFHVLNSLQLSAVVPAGSGTVDVRVLTPDGESAIAPADQFTYEFVPQLVKSAKASARWKGKSVVVSPGITLRCPQGGQSCDSWLSAHSKVRGKLGGKAKNQRVGLASAVTDSGGHRALTFKLNRKGLSALKRQGHLRIVVQAKATDGIEQATATKTITIRLPKKS